MSYDLLSSQHKLGNGLARNSTLYTVLEKQASFCCSVVYLYWSISSSRIHSQTVSCKWSYQKMLCENKLQNRAIWGLQNTVAPSYSNMVVLNFPVFQTKNDFHYLPFSHLLLGISNSCYFKLFFHIPWEFKIVGFNCISKLNRSQSYFLWQGINLMKWLPSNYQCNITHESFR